MRSVKPYVWTNTLKSIFYSYFQSVMTYDLFFWGNSPDSIKTFRLQKKIIRIMMGCRIWDSYRKLFFRLEILPLPSHFILSLLLFMIRNNNQFLMNTEMYHINTRQHANLHHPSVRVTECQKAVYCLGVKLFNVLLPYIKSESDNPKKFKGILQNFYMTNLFIHWRNILNFKKVKYSHINWIDIWQFWHICSFSLYINLYHITVCKILPS